MCDRLIKEFPRGNCMKNKKSPFGITNAMIDCVAEITELMGRLMPARGDGGRVTRAVLLQYVYEKAKLGEE